MKYLNVRCYVEVKGKRYINHPFEKNVSKKRDLPKSLRTQYQLQNETGTKKNQKVFKNDNNQFYLKIILERENQLFNNLN